jgi:WD40 repeat protein
MQLLTAWYHEEREKGKPETKELVCKEQLIYPSGNLVVIEDCSKAAPLRTPSQRFFSQHAEDVACLAVHPNGYLVATADAGAEPTLIMWHSDTLAKVRDFSEQALEIRPTDDDYLGKTRLAGGLEALPTYGALTRQHYVAARLCVHDARDAAIAKGVFLKIDKEIMCVEETDGNRLVCRRAMQGTGAAAHVNGALVLVYQPSYRHEQSGGIACLTFTKCDWGSRLVSVSANKTHTIVVYDTANGRVTQQGEGGRDTILAVGAHPKDDVIVTCGVNHLVFWKVAGTKLKGDMPQFADLGRPQTFLCLDFCYAEYQGYDGQVWSEGCPGGIVTLTGSADGYIYMWEHNLLRKIVKVAHTGPIFDLFVPDAGQAELVTAGQDGSVR